jgi:hypothetical protein
MQCPIPTCWYPTASLQTTASSRNVSTWPQTPSQPPRLRHSMQLSGHRPGQVPDVATGTTSRITNHHKLQKPIDGASDTISGLTSCGAVSPITNTSRGIQEAPTVSDPSLGGFGPFEYHLGHFLDKATGTTAEPHSEQTSNHMLHQRYRGSTLGPSGYNHHMLYQRCRYGPLEYQPAQVTGKATSTIRLVPPSEQTSDHTLHQSYKRCISGPEYQPAQLTGNLVPTSTARQVPFSVQPNGHRSRHGPDMATVTTSLISIPAASPTMTTSMGNPMCTVSPHNAQTNHHNLHQCIGAAPDAINPTRIWAASSTVSTSTGSLAPAVSGRAPPVCGLRPSEYHAAHVLGKVTSTIRLVPLSGQTSDHMPQQIDSSSTMGPSGGDTGWPPPNSIITPTGSSFPAGPDRSPSCRYSAPPEYQPTQAFGNVVPITATLIPHSEQTNNHQLHQSIDVASDITSPTSILAAIPMTTLTGCQALAITNRSSLLRGFGPLGYQPVRFLGKVTSSTARWVPLSEQTRYHTIPQCEQTNHHKLQQSIDVASDTISPPSTSAACPTTTTSTGSQVPATTCRPPLFHGLGPQEHQLAQVRGKVTSTARLVPQREQVYDHTLQSDRSSTTGPSEYRPARPVRNVVPTSAARPGPVS